jgi:hypothetical protein
MALGGLRSGAGLGWGRECVLSGTPPGPFHGAMELLAGCVTGGFG